MSETAETDSSADARYKIGEVCRLADVQPYVLRYWESEFPSLAVDRTATGPRSYSSREVRIIERIKKLLYDEGYTIAGAKKRLEAELKNGPIEATESTESYRPPARPEGMLFEDETGPLPQPPPLPQGSSGSEGRGRRGRNTRTVSVLPPLSEASLVYEESISSDSDPRNVDPSTATVVKREDPRVTNVITELKEVLALLSRPEP